MRLRGVMLPHQGCTVRDGKDELLMCFSASWVCNVPALTQVCMPVCATLLTSRGQRSPGVSMEGLFLSEVGSRGSAWGRHSPGTLSTHIRRKRVRASWVLGKELSSHLCLLVQCLHRIDSEGCRGLEMWSVRQGWGKAETKTQACHDAPAQ